MPAPDDVLSALYEAVRLAPDNVALRVHLAETLLSFSRSAEAGEQFNLALKTEPNNDRIKLGLARTYFEQRKDSHAMVVVEELIRRDAPPPEAYILFARLLLREGDPDRAARQYRTALDLDPSLADSALAEQLDVPSDASSGQFDDADDITPDGRMRMRRDDLGEAPDIEMERPALTFADVGGMEKLKEEIRMKIIHPLTHPEIYKSYGKAIGGGILMYGPPGCGKTHMARATAGEVKAGFMAIGIHDVLDMWIGSSEQRLHELFEQARRNKPCVLFFDEVDALGASRTDMRHSAGRLLINQFLSELDGVKNSNEGVLILAATNAPWHLDSAFRRPGRFDRILFVPPPDALARREILRIMVKDKPTKDVDFDLLAKKTDGCSGADIKALIDISIEAKLKQAMFEGVPAPLTTKDFRAAAKGIKPTTREWFSTARNYALYSNQGGVYDDILTYMGLK